jgi:predicted RNA-binding Zn ribbon-like protein
VSAPQSANGNPAGSVLIASHHAANPPDGSPQRPCRLHFHGSGGSTAGDWAASCATGLAIVLGSEFPDRLGVCTASRYDRVYVDVSGNGTRRFCSTACQNRVKTAAFRARSRVE